VAEVAGTLIRESAVGASATKDLLADFADRIRLDSDLLTTIVALQGSREEYLFDHCVNTAALSMTLGAGLGLDDEQVLELATGALLADVGMLRVPNGIRLASRTLTSTERHEIERHPCHTYDCLQKTDAFPASATLVGYQVHERLDRSGYPLGRPGFILHEYSKIAAVADTYAAQTKPRPHRPRILPYTAVATILRDCSLGKYESAVVRTFLDTVGLFPIRSFVELSNGVRAVVIRTNPGLHTRPVTAAVAGDYSPTDQVIDLAKEPDLEVVRALDPHVPPGGGGGEVGDSH
jgi:HD-GYP domain-containing protein (c-di-GMP phosphodiesterase class II)